MSQFCWDIFDEEALGETEDIQSSNHEAGYEDDRLDKFDLDKWWAGSIVSKLHLLGFIRDIINLRPGAVSYSPLVKYT